MDTLQNGEIRNLPESVASDATVSDIHGLSARFANRGIVSAVRREATEQSTQEEQTRAMAPDAYRLSLLSEEEISARYREQNENMNADGLIRYFRETRKLRTDRIESFDEPDTVEETASAPEALPVQAGHGTLSDAVQKARQLPAAWKERIRKAIPTWFDTKAADTSKNRKTFPLSAFAAAVAVAVSLMLIIAGNVMMNRAESEWYALNDEIAAVRNDISELNADFCAGNDLLGIREIAVREYGMVGEEYVRMQHLSSGDGDSIEQFESDRRDEVGLSALLSAIGIKK